MWYAYSYWGCIMSYSLEIKLKEGEQPSMWGRLLRWLDGETSPMRSGQQVPKTGTNTEILLSQTQARALKEAVTFSGERPADTTTFVKRTDSSQDNSELII